VISSRGFCSREKAGGGRPCEWQAAKYSESGNLRGSGEKMFCAGLKDEQGRGGGGNPREVIQPCEREEVETRNYGIRKYCSRCVLDGMGGY
jgi:hypothetical protein